MLPFCFSCGKRMTGQSKYGLIELHAQQATFLSSTKEKEHLCCRHFLSKEGFKFHKEREEIFHSKNDQVPVIRTP